MAVGRDETGGDKPPLRVEDRTRAGFSWRIPRADRDDFPVLPHAQITPVGFLVRFPGDDQRVPHEQSPRSKPAGFR